MPTSTPTKSGVMRGWLGTIASPEEHRLWFVLSSETLTYYETPDEQEQPLGMLGIDEMRSICVSKRSETEFHLTITLTDERFERRLAYCVNELVMRAELAEADETPATDVDCYDMHLAKRASVTIVDASNGSSSASMGTDDLELARQWSAKIRSTAISAISTDGGDMWSRLRAWLRQGLQPGLQMADEAGDKGQAWSAAILEVQGRFLSAAQARQWDLVRDLALAGRDVNLREAGNQRTALHYAAGYGATATARLLVQLGAQVNVPDRTGMTPLGWACLKGHVELAQLLLKSNADPLITVHSGVLVNKTALALARLHGEKGESATARAQQLVHHLLMHSGAALYKVHQILGQGGFAKVLAVTRHDSAEMYAMKAILKHGSGSKGMNAKLIRQAQIEKHLLQRVNHPFIVDMKGAFQTRDKLLLILELCPGGDLKAHLPRGGFDQKTAAFCSAQMVLALEYLHGHRIIHRDIKLENILVDGEGYIRLTDFNVAKLLTERRTFSMKGTLFAMAPEVIVKGGHDVTADFWSFGVLIYELLTGMPPFYASNKEALKRMILGTGPNRVEVAFPPEMSSACRMLLQQLLVREPKLRLGARRQDVALMKAHPYFGRMDWEALFRRQLLSPLKDGVEHMTKLNGVGKSRYPLATCDRELPSPISRKSCSNVDDWDYVSPGG